MGLAPYGTPKFEKLIFDHLVELKDDGSFRLNLEYFDFCTGIKMFRPKFETLFGGRARLPETTITQHTADIAASIQVALEKIIARIVLHTRAETQERNLCLAGGVALNCVANGKILRSGVFDKIWIQPAAGDAGGALGAALGAHHLHFKGATPKKQTSLRLDARELSWPPLQRRGHRGRAYKRRRGLAQTAYSGTYRARSEVTQERICSGLASRRYGVWSTRPGQSLNLSRRTKSRNPNRVELED